MSIVMAPIPSSRSICILSGSRSIGIRYCKEVAERVRAIVREECRKSGVDILKGHVSSNHVHVLVSIPPQVTISRLIQRMKGKSSYHLLREFSHLRKRSGQTH